MFPKNFKTVFRHFKKIIFSSIVVILFCCPSVQADIDPVLAARLQNAIDSVRNHYNYKGVSAYIFIPSKGTWTGTSGVSHGAVAITPDMKFGIGSNTKTFIAVLMLKLQEMNVLSLDDSLYKWIPNFQYVDPFITIRQLLNHTSGIYNYTTFPGFGNVMASDTSRYWTPEELLTTFMNPPYFNPGTGYQYSNTNYILAGMIIKAATGNSISHNLRELILNPSNLNNIYFPHEESIPEPIAHGWQGSNEIKYPRTSGWSAAWTAGAIFSTAVDMVRFYKELFDLQIINQSSLNQMLTFPGQPYGLGIFRGFFFGKKFFFHDGSISGYTSIAGIDSAAKFILSVGINQTPSIPPHVVAALYQVILEHLSTDISNSGISVPEEFSLSQNYPNPFNPATTVKYSLPKASFVRLKVYDILGNEVLTLVNSNKNAGVYTEYIDGAALASGVYYYSLYVDGQKIDSKKMMLVK